MAKVSQVGIHGRMRQRIVAVGRAHTNWIVPLQSRRGISKDKYLHTLLQSGVITPDQLETTIRSYNKTPSEFAWMSDVDDAVLDKADRVFLDRYDRFPTEDTDFRLNGNYYRICRSLQHDWYYYDHQLERLHSDDEDKPSVHQTEPAELLEEAPKRTREQGQCLGFWLGACGRLRQCANLRGSHSKGFPRPGRRHRLSRRSRMAGPSRRWSYPDPAQAVRTKAQDSQM